MGDATKSIRIGIECLLVDLWEEGYKIGQNNQRTEDKRKLEEEKVDAYDKGYDKGYNAGLKTEATNEMTMKLDKHSEEDLKLCRPGVGVIFMKTAENEIMVTEFTPKINNTLGTIPITTYPGDLHDWIDYIYYNTIPKKNEVSKQNGI